MSDKKTDVVDVDRTPVAKEIWCYNPTEKAFTWHVVVNHNSKGLVDRVQCKTTGTIRKYKPQKDAPAPGAPGTAVKKPAAKRKSVPRAPAFDHEKAWHDGIKSWGAKSVASYSADRSLQVKEVFDHPTFGKGVVQGRRESRVDVIFSTGIKTLFSPIT